MIAPAAGVHRVRVAGRSLVVKRATGCGREHLRREAELLRATAGPGVAGLFELRDEDDHTDLITDDAGRDLTEVRPPDLLAGLRLAAAACDAVAALHTRGWLHGALCAEHVAVGRDGTATLVSLGSAVPTHGADDVLRLELRLLGDLVLALVEGSPPTTTRDPIARLARHREQRRLHDLVDETVEGRHDGGLDRDRAARLADLLREDLAAVDRAGRYERSDDTHGPSRRRRPGGARRAGAALGLAVVVAGVLGVLGVLALGITDDDHGTGARADARSTPIPADTAAETAERPGAVAANVVRHDGTTYRLGRPGDRPVLGDWDCDGEVTPVLLRPSTGDVISFDRWARSRESLAGRPVQRVDDAVDLLRRTGPRPGCDDLAVLLGDGTTVDIGLDAPPPDTDEAPP